MNDPQIDMGTGIPTHAVSLIDNGAEEFPVLKAFQQYIDAEQDKARRRMLSLCIFFGCLMTIIIVVFIFLLNGVSQRNQQLNDRLIEYVMKDRDRQPSAPVVVQPSADNSAVYGLTQKIDEMQKKLSEAQAKADAAEQARQAAADKAAADKAAAEEAAKAAREKARIREQLEVTRLKAELAAEREKAAAEKEKKHQEELEAYRRLHYPELYEKPKPKTPSVKPVAKPVRKPAAEEPDPIDVLLKDLNEKDPLDDDDGLDDTKAIKYFDDDSEEGQSIPSPRVKSPSRPKPVKTQPVVAVKKPVEAPSKPATAEKKTITEAPKETAKAKETAREDPYVIPVEVRGKKSRWRIPNE